MRRNCRIISTIWARRNGGNLQRLRLVKPKRKTVYKQNIFEQQRLQLEAELTARGFEGSASEIDLLLRGGSIPSGAGLRIFTATIDCRKMTNGVSDTDGKALTIHALNDLRRTFSLTDKKYFTFGYQGYTVYINSGYTYS